MNKEITGVRDLKYNNWHRTLGNNCYAWNLDWVEVRPAANGELKIVAFIETAETTKFDSACLTWKSGHVNILNQLTKMTGIPSYVVYHDNTLSKFKRFDLQNNTVEILDQDFYRIWLIKLGT